MNRVAGVSEAQPQLDVFWLEGAQEFSLSVSPGALREIKGEVIRGFKAIPRRGAEVGGLLQGTIQHSANRCRIYIEEARTVAIEYRYGPSYRLSEIDEGLFQQALNQEDKHQFVGWYRSNTRVQKFPDATDRVRSARYFGDDESIFLLLQPDASGVISAQIGIWSSELECSFEFEFGRFPGTEKSEQAAPPTEGLDGKPLARQSQLPINQKLPPASQLPLSVQSRRADGPSSPSAGTQALPNGKSSRVAGQANDISPMATPVARHASAVPRQQGARIHRAALVACGIIALVMAGSAGYYWWQRDIRSTAVQQRPPTAPTPAAVSEKAGVESDAIGLKLDHQGGSLLISWNKQAPEILQAESGTFVVKEGSRTRILPLDPHALRTGSIYYRHRGDDVEIQLEVQGSRGTYSQSARMIGSLPVAVSRSSQLPENPERHMSPAAENPPVVADAMIVSSSPATAGENERRFSSPPSSPRAEQKKVALVEPPALQGHADLATALKLPSQVQPARPSPPSANSSAPPASNSQGSTSSTAPAPAASSAPSPTVNPSAVQLSTASQNTGNAAAPAYVPPRAIKSVQPKLLEGLLALPSGASSNITYGQQVQVLVTIGATGEVTAAKIVKATGPLAGVLSKASIDAAWKWRFEPARLQGRAVQSDMTLYFNFSRDPNLTRF